MNRLLKRNFFSFTALLVLIVTGYYYYVTSTETDIQPTTPTVKKKAAILCLVLARPNAIELQQAIIDTWGTECADLLFLFANRSLTNSALIPQQKNIYSLILPVEEHFDNTWMKIRAAMRYVNSNWLNKFDWLMRIDDDAFVVFENLRTLIAPLSPDQPIMFGAYYDKLYQGYIGTGPGILLSRGAFTSLMGVFDDGRLCQTTLRTHNDDVQLGACLRAAKIPFGNSSDHNRPRYISISLYHLLNATTSNERKFFKTYSAYPIGEGLECCADEIVALHYTSASDIRLYFQRMQAHPNSKKNLKLFVTGVETPRS